MSELREALGQFVREVVHRQSPKKKERPPRFRPIPPELPQQDLVAEKRIKLPKKDDFYDSVELEGIPREIETAHGPKIRELLKEYDQVVAELVRQEKVRKREDGSYEIDRERHTDEEYEVLGRSRGEAGDLVDPYEPGKGQNKDLRKQVLNSFTLKSALERLTAIHSQGEQPI